MRKFLFIALATVTVPAYALVIHGHSYVSSCTGFSIGNLCPVDSLFVSIIGTIILTIVVVGIRVVIGAIWSRLTGGDR
jgi:hypothetical protein